MVSEQTMLFSPIELNLFLGLSHVLNNEMINSSYVCDSVIVWFCYRFVCLTLNVSSFLCLNILQSAPNLVQMFLNVILRDVFFANFLFLWFLLIFFSFLWLRHFWVVKSRPLPNRIFMVSMFLWGIWTIIRLLYYWVCCAKMCIYWVIALINCSVGLSWFLGEIQTPLISSFYGFYGIKGPFQKKIY